MHKPNDLFLAALTDQHKRKILKSAKTKPASSKMPKKGKPRLIDIEKN